VLGVTSRPRGMTATYLAAQLMYAQASGSCQIIHVKKHVRLFFCRLRHPGSLSVQSMMMVIMYGQTLKTCSDRIEITLLFTETVQPCLSSDFAIPREFWLRRLVLERGWQRAFIGNGETYFVA
jgi:hypothetical protein